MDISCANHIKKLQHKPAPSFYVGAILGSVRQRLAHHIKNFNIKLFANAAAAANARGSTIALPGLRPGELTMKNTMTVILIIIGEFDYLT